MKRHGYLHFVLVTGFEEDNVFFYDPLLSSGELGFTVDNNDLVTGNDTLQFSAFFDLWNEVLVLGFYENLAVVVDKP